MMYEMNPFFSLLHINSNGLHLQEVLKNTFEYSKQKLKLPFQLVPKIMCDYYWKKQKFGKFMKICFPSYFKLEKQWYTQNEIQKLIDIDMKKKLN